MNLDRYYQHAEELRRQHATLTIAISLSLLNGKQQRADKYLMARQALESRQRHLNHHILRMEA